VIDELTDLVSFLVRGLVDHPDAVEVRVHEGVPTLYEVQVAPEDQGRVIGREGRTIRSLRTLVQTAARKSGLRASLELVD
jgi:predicted RNA-binding protein YlqC (UPF0109 family)